MSYQEYQWIVVTARFRHNPATVLLLEDSEVQRAVLEEHVMRRGGAFVVLPGSS